MSNLFNKKQLQNPVDSTSYIYSKTGKAVPLKNDFLKFEFLNSTHLKENKPGSGKLSTEIVSHEGDGKPTINLNYTDGILFLLLALFSLIAYVRISGKNYLHRIFTSLINFNYSNSFFKEKNLAYTLNNNVLMIVFFVATSLFLQVVSDYFNYPQLVPGKWQQLFFFAATMLILVVIYKLVYRLLGIIIGFYHEISEFLFFFTNLLKILGIAYVILLFGSFFSTSTGKAIFIYIAIFITILMFFAKFYRILIIFFKNRFPLYYMILYFCALEIIPVIFVTKLLILIKENEFSFINLLV